MHFNTFTLVALLGAVSAIPASQNADGTSLPPFSTFAATIPSDYNSASASSTQSSYGGTPTYLPSSYINTPPTSSYPSNPQYSHPGGDCGDYCGGVCGDKIVQYPYEQCDLGPELNGAPGSGCDAHCQKCGYCGDGHIDPELGEQCDLGKDLNGAYHSGCDASCHICPWCGDGHVDSGEQCDLGDKNGEWNSGCSANCTITPVCGDGIIQPPEECDAGVNNGAYNSGCSSECKLCGYCGDGIVDDAAGEQCDNGWKLNGTPGSKCSANCTLETCKYECGNGIVEPGEDCDHGWNNGKPGDSCSSACKWVTCSCGDGITEYPEECDDGDLNGTPYSYCSKNCTWLVPCGNPQPPKCGDGIVQYPETCDDGWYNGQVGSNCTTECTLCGPEPPRCGDGHVDPGEDCDDGAANGTPQSKCDTQCKWCAGPPSGGSGGNGTCESCNPNPFFNLCHITTSCITTPTSIDYCACRAGYKGDNLPNNDSKQFRLAFPGQEYRVFVAPGISCDTLCDAPFPGPQSCQEIPVKSSC